ncbi:MAG TPA: glycosyltransferase family 4 protein [Baekduia sp.]|nr:glycosyltransferase family 4 protein [Baekduia sp.]
MPLRVLNLSWEYPPVIEGGLARHVRKLSEALVAGQDVEVHVITRAGASTAPREDRHGVIVHRVETPPFPLQTDRFLDWVAGMNDGFLARGRELCEQLGFDVVHGHDWLVADASHRLAAIADAPFVATIHATEHGRHQGAVTESPRSQIHAIERWMAHRADHLIVCSHYMRDHVSAIFALDPARIEVIPNGIDAADLRPVSDLPALRARFAAPSERLILLIGRLVYEKGFQDALDALGGAGGLIDRLGNVRFVIAGSGNHEPELRARAAALGLDAHGSFLGWAGDDLLHSLYRVADLTVVPSIYEPFGLVALEAMASGCACIVADTGGLREVVPASAAAFRFASGDSVALGRAMERVLTEPVLRDQLVADAAAHVQSFDWDDVAARTAAAYGAVRVTAST